MPYQPIFSITVKCKIDATCPGELMELSTGAANPGRQRNPTHQAQKRRAARFNSPRRDLACIRVNSALRRLDPCMCNGRYLRDCNLNEHVASSRNSTSHQVAVPRTTLYSGC